MSRETDSPAVEDSPHDPDNLHQSRVLCDRQHKIPLTGGLSKDDLVLLLTPVVPPTAGPPWALTDPFEPLGKALSRFVSVRHVPYGRKRGITGIHVAFIRRVKAVVLVLAALEGEGDGERESQIDIGALVRQTCEAKQPLFVVACCRLAAEDLHNVLVSEFTTVITTNGYSHRDLTDAVGTLTGASSEGDEQMASPTVSPRQPTEVHNLPNLWVVEEWNFARDAAATHALWLDTMPTQFRLDRTTLDELLSRPGFSRHWVVRCPQGRILGFCATFTTYVDSFQDRPVGFIASILVREGVRGLGIGKRLQREAMAKLRATNGVNRIQLGSAFPRLLRGLPLDLPQRKWFMGKGWIAEENGRGTGSILYDWLALFADLHPHNLASAGLTFRRCQFGDFQQVYEVITKSSRNKLCYGGYQLYTATLDSDSMKNIILGFEGGSLAVAAITYTPSDGSPAAKDIPWPGTLGPDIGGITCMFFNDDDPEIINRKDTIMIRLLDSCIRALHDRGMIGVYLDAVAAGHSTLELLGFRKWAGYQEVWQQS